MVSSSKVSKSMPVRVTWNELQHFEEHCGCFDKWVSMCRSFSTLHEAEEFCMSKLSSGVMVQRMSAQLVIAEADMLTKLGVNLMASGRLEDVQ